MSSASSTAAPHMSAASGRPGPLIGLRAVELADGVAGPYVAKLLGDYGADVVKIFPTGSAGGPAHIKAVRAVFPDAVFCPTGGVDAGNAPDYLAAGAAFVGIGGKLVDEARIAAGDKAAIQRAARDALGLMQA